MSEKPLSELLQAVARVRPYAFSDFYRRGRPVRRNPPPLPPLLTFLITGRCSLGCSFCFAKSATRRGIEISPERLRPVLEKCKGVSKAVILGGEPFEHPGLKDIIKSSMTVISEEVEIFTNGRLLPDDTRTLNDLLRSMEGGNTGPKLVLTLAVDQFHSEKLGVRKLEARICQFLELKGKYGWNVRFNISDTAFHPEQYLARNVIAPVLRGISPELEQYFSALRNPEDIESGFYFNPLFRQGGVAPDACNTFPLRLSELARGGDLVVAPDLGDPMGKERLALFNSLNAACASPPPGAAVMGHMEGPGAKCLPNLCAKALAGGRPSSASLVLPLQAGDIFTGMKQLHDNPAAGWRKVAKRLLPLALDTGELIAEAAAWSEGVRLPFPALHALAGMLQKCDRPAFEKNLRSFAGDFVAFLGNGAGPRAPVLVSGWVDGMARIPASGDIRVSLNDVCLDTGLGYWPGEKPHPVRPEVMISPGAMISWRMPGLATALPGETTEAELVYYTGFWRLLLGEAAWKYARPKILELVNRRFPSKSDEKLILARSVSSREIPGRILLKSGSGDPLKLFGFFAYDPGRGGVAWDDKRLLKLVFQGRWPNWEKEKVKKLKAEMASGLKGFERL